MAKKTIGTLLVEIGVDITQFEKKMNDLHKQVNNLGTQMQDAGQQIATAFGGVALAIGAGLGVAVKKAADFEQGLSNIKAVSGATSKEMAILEQLALDMGASTKYSATEAATGIEELVKAGVSMTDIMNGGLKGALSLAIAGGLELAEAAEIASTALNAFRKDGLTVSKAADILAGGANASATSVQELKFGLSQVSAVASMVGFTFEDTTTALSVFAQNGLKGSDAGTSLKTMMMNLQPQTKDQIALAKELGIVTADGSNAFYDAAGNIKSLDKISGVLQKSLKGMTAAQQQQTLETLFGADAVRAASILYKEGEKGVNNMKAAMSKVTAEQVAAEKMNNLNGAIEQLKGAFETLMISIGDTLLPMLKGIAKALGGIVDWFNQLSPTTKKVITYILAAVAALAGLAAITGVVVAITGALVAVEWAVVAPILATVGVVVLVIAAFAALVAAIVILYKKNEEFRILVDSVWNFIKQAIKSVVEMVIPIIKDLWSILKDGLTDAWNIIRPIFVMIGDAIMDVINYFKQGGERVEWLKTIVSVAFKIIGTSIKIQLTLALGIIKFVLNAMVTAFKFSFAILKAVVKTVFSAIQTIVKNGIAIVKGIIDVATKLIKGDWKGAWESVKKTFNEVWDNIVRYLTGLKDTFLEAGKGLINAIKDGIVGAAKGLYDTVKGVAGKIRDFLPFSPAKTGPLSDLDKLDFGGPISSAIKSGAPDVQAQMDAMLAMPSVNPTVTAGIDGNTTIIMQLDGKTIAKSTFNQMGGVFRVRGAVT